MNEQHLFTLICDPRLKTLVQDGKEAEIYETYALSNDLQTIEEAIQTIKFLEAQRIQFTAEEIQHNYQNVLHKILF